MSNSDNNVKSGGSAGVPDNKGKLFDAASKGLFSECEKLIINDKVDVNEAQPDGETPLWIASKKGYYIICELLIKYRAAINKANKDLETPLCIAADNNHLSVCELLVKHGANANIGRKWGVLRQTPYAIAETQGYYDVSDFLRWYTTNSSSKDDRFLMIVVALQELILYHEVDALSLIDLLQMT